MDTKKIKALLKAIDLGSLSSAAEDLGYTQSGLTHMMNSLEDEFGISLLIRNKSGVHLSPPGQKLLQDMKALVDASNKLEHDIDAIKEHSFSTLKIGAYSSVARTWLPSILESYKLVNPETEFLLSMQDIRTLYEAVKNEELDCAVVSYQEELMSGLSWTPLRDDELVAILPGKYSVEEGSFPIDYFSGMDFLMPSDGFEMDILPIFGKISSKLLPNFRYTNMDDAAIVSMVTHGLGVSILSRLIMQSVKEEIAVVSLTPKAYRKLGIIVKSRRQGDKSIKNFIATSKNVLNALQ
ncbi:MAG: LysR family transcriptional regulator [Eubacteriales bacterium]|nr:LysR family transcriptional regulator [Eubacteriales bacterium]